jgi:hypothetical protein
MPGANRVLPCQWGGLSKMRVLPYVSLALCLWVGSCHSDGEPKIRVGCYPTSTPGMRFIDLNDLGPHGYHHEPGEGNGIVYTCRAGHIDITHVRACADWTKYIAEKAYACLLADEMQFSFKSNVESSRHYIDIEYPPDWTDLPHDQRDSLAWVTAVDMAQYLIFTAATWHEILTWFGHRYLSPFPEFPSAFSWEDSFSNLLGTHLAGQVLHASRQDYDRRFTESLEAELCHLNIQSRATARDAAESVKGHWYQGRMPGFVKMQCRNLDVGLSDGIVSPVRIASVAPCQDIPAVAYPIPSLVPVQDNGFAIKTTIVPREWIKGRILRIVYPLRKTRKKHIDPALHFPLIMAKIHQEAMQRDMICSNPEE